MSTSPLVGSWLLDISDQKGLYTFLPDGTYWSAQMVPDNDYYQSGLEYGTYTWDAGSGVFTANLSADTNGDWGLSSPSGSYVIRIDEDTATVTDSAFPGESLYPTRLDTSQSANPLVGVWQFSNDSGGGIFTFLDDDTFWFVEVGPDEVSGQSGMEYGTYTWNADTGVFSCAIIEDTNGDWGASDPVGSYVLQVDGNTLQASDTGDPDEQATLLTRADATQSTTSYTLAEDEETLVLTGSAPVNGTGNSLDNVITGNSATNTLDGGGGDDYLDGGAGNDRLIGGSGSDTLSGGAGTDTLVGGSGSDTYIVDNVNDVVTESSNAKAALATGIDKVKSSVNWTLGNYLENLTLTGSSRTTGKGNALANKLTGNRAANTLKGGGGNDTHDGGAGNDTLNGESGNDTLNGGAGTDTLTGGSGRDYFQFTSKSEGQDKITDFSSADGDKLTFKRGNFGNLTAGALSGSLFVANASGTATTTSQRFVFNTTSKVLYYDSNGSASGGSTALATLNTTISASHILLVS